MPWKMSSKSQSPGPNGQLFRAPGEIERCDCENEQLASLCRKMVFFHTEVSMNHTGSVSLKSDTKTGNYTVAGKQNYLSQQCVHQTL